MRQGDKGEYAVSGKSLGNVLDGWSELLDNHANQEDTLRANFISNMQGRNVPNVEHTDGAISMNGESRQFYFSTRRSGASVTTYIGKYGNDLFVKWTLWWQPQLNWKVVLGILAVSILLGFIRSSSMDNPYMPDGALIVVFILTAVATIIFLVIIVAVLGLLLRGSFVAFFRTEFNMFNQDDAIALSFAVDHALRQAADAVGIKIKLRERTDFYSGKRSRLI